MTLPGANVVIEPGAPALTQRDAGYLPFYAGLGVVVLALALQIFLPLYVGFVRSLDLPLLAVVYLALMQKSKLSGLAIGVLVGLGQDALTRGPLGVFGIVKSVTGYAAASAGQFLEMDYPGIRGVLAGFFFLLNQAGYWFIQSVLLNNHPSITMVQTLLLSLAHVGLALVAFRSLDRLKRTV